MDVDITEIPTPWLLCRWRSRHAFDAGRLELDGRTVARWSARCERCDTVSKVDYKVTRSGATVKKIERATTTITYEWTEDYRRLMHMVTSADACQEVLRRQIEGYLRAVPAGA